MKQFLYFLFFGTVFFGFDSMANAQTLKEPAQLSQKADDGILVAYPNPVKDFVIVRAKDPMLKIKMVTFYSILGTQVAQFTVNMNAGEINLDRLRPGKYLMKYVLSDNTQKVAQILKQ